MTNQVPRWLFFSRLSICLAALLVAPGWAGSAFGGPAGSLDADFTLSENSAGQYVDAIAVQPDGKIVFGGFVFQVGNALRSDIARVQVDGTLDAGFVPPTIQSYNTLTDSIITSLDSAFFPVVLSTTLQPDGKILVGGSFYFVNGKPGYGGLIRLNSDGSLDTSFVAPRFDGSVFSVVLLGGGNMLVGGDFIYAGNKKRNCLVELDATGALLGSFDAGLFAGTTNSVNAVSEVSAVHTIGLQSDGKIVIGGIFTSVAGSPRRGIARLNEDGSVDSSFVPDASFNPVGAGQPAAIAIDQVLSLVLQSDGKIVAGGDFVDPSTGTGANGLFRFNTNGSLDSSFNPGGTGTLNVTPGSSNPPPPTTTGSNNGIVEAVTLDGNGKILLSGTFLVYNGKNAFTVARLEQDGTLDTTFNDGFGPNGNALALALQSNGELLVGGDFSAVDGVFRPFLARLYTTTGVPTVTVGIVASKKFAGQPGDTKGAFTITRSGSNQTADLNVDLTLSGTAIPGVDYRRLPGQVQSTAQVTIPAGSSSAVIKVVPLHVGSSLANKKLTVTLSPTPAYGLRKASASVIIVEQP